MIDPPPDVVHVQHFVDAPVYAKVDFYRGFPIFVNVKTGIVTVMDNKKRFKPVLKVGSEKVAKMWVDAISEVK